MASEIRVDKITSLSGVGTITPSPTGIEISGITTVTTLKATTGIVTTLTANTGIVTTFEATTGNITTLRAPTGIVTTFTADTARINTTSLASTKLSIQSTATSGSGSACGLRVGNNVTGALTKYPAEIEVRTTAVENHNAIRTDAGDGNGGFTAGVQGYNGFLNLTTGGTDVVGVKLSADGNTNFFNGSNQLAANVGIGTTIVGGATNLTLGRRDTTNEGGELGFCRANDGTQYWQMDCYGNDSTPALRLHRSGSTTIVFLAGGGICPSGESNADNALDDYEEGTWVPNIYNDGSTSNWTAKDGDYQKVGKTVTVWMRVDGGTAPRSGGSSGHLTITGLPFALSGMDSNTILGIGGGNFTSSGSIDVNISTAGSGNPFVRRGGSNYSEQCNYFSACFTYKTTA